MDNRDIKNRPDMLFFDRLISEINTIVKNHREEISGNSTLQKQISEFVQSIYLYGHAHFTDFTILKILSTEGKFFELPSDRCLMPPTESLWEDIFKSKLPQIAKGLDQLPIFHELQKLFVTEDPSITFTATSKLASKPRVSTLIKSPQLEKTTTIHSKNNVPEIISPSKPRTDNNHSIFRTQSEKTTPTQGLLQPFINDRFLEQIELGEKNFDFPGPYTRRYYYITEDDKIKPPDNLVVHLTGEGADLIIEYYADKYNSNIQPVHYLDEIKAIVANKVKTPQADDNSSTSKDFRMGFHYHPIGEPHATPILYLEKNGQKLFLIADSFMAGQVELVIELQQATGIRVLSIEDVRQSDSDSCITDSTVFLRIATAFDKQNNEYVLKDLYSYLVDHTATGFNIEYTKLPEDFLILSQISAFIELHKTDDHKIIHRLKNKDITFSEYLEKYKAEADTVKSGKKPINTYLNKKGFKFADLIEIQFYIRQIRDLLKDQWTNDIRDRFIQAAKKELAAQPPHRKEFGKRYRPGLKTFAEAFISDELRQLKIIPTTSPEIQANQSVLQGLVSSDNNNTIPLINKDLFLSRLNELCRRLPSRKEYLYEPNWSPIKLMLVELSTELTLKKMTSQEVAKLSQGLDQMQRTINQLILEKKLNPNILLLIRNEDGKQLVKKLVIDTISISPTKPLQLLTKN